MTLKYFQIYISSRRQRQQSKLTFIYLSYPQPTKLPKTVAIISNRLH